jgi:hypothetical protein
LCLILFGSTFSTISVEVLYETLCTTFLTLFGGLTLFTTTSVSVLVDSLITLWCLRVVSGRRKHHRVIKESTSTETEVVVNRVKPPKRVKKVVHKVS